MFTAFPSMVMNYCGESLLEKAIRNGLIDVRAHDLRSHATGVHKAIDDSPFGGGAGMVLMPEPIFACVEAVAPPRPLLLLDPGGRRFDHAMAVELAGLTDGFSLLCGRYEGVDHRIREHLCDGEVSIGDFVLAGGELGALVIIEAVARLVPGVLGNADSPLTESFADDLLEGPHYTRPAVFRDWAVPDVVRSGDHRRIAAWRKAESMERTKRNRPDLLS